MSTDTQHRELIIEAVAGLDAAASVFASLNGGVETPPTEFFMELASNLKYDALGPAPQDDEGFDRDPVNIAVAVRSAELTAEALTSLGLNRRARRYRTHAREMRENGTVAVPFRDEPPAERAELEFKCLCEALTDLEECDG